MPNYIDLSPSIQKLRAVEEVIGSNTVLSQGGYIFAAVNPVPKILSSALSAGGSAVNLETDAITNALYGRLVLVEISSTVPALLTLWKNDNGSLTQFATRIINSSVPNVEWHAKDREFVKMLGSTGSPKRFRVTATPLEPAGGFNGIVYVTFVHDETAT